MLLERDDLLARLTALARQAEAGRGCTVLVSGEAGIGKTALLERFAAGLEAGTDAARGRVLWGGCEALVTPRPLGPLHDLAAQTASGLRARVLAGGDRASLFAAVLEEFSLPPPPTVMVFEDVHWADDATLDLVKYLGRRIHRLAALLLLSHRDDEASLDRLRGVLGELPPAHVSRIVVPPLSLAAVEQMALASACPGSAGLHALTGGNAFFVAEMLRQGSDAVAGPTTTSIAVPVTVRDAVLARAAKLPSAAAELLQFVAVVPRRAAMSLVDAVLAPGSDAVEACLASGLLVAEDHALRFRHELARTAVEAALLAPRATALHGRVLAALDGLPEGVTSIAARAHHAQRAGDAAAVLRWAPLAAREAAHRGARREAASHCRAALAYAGLMTDNARAALLDELATHSFELNDLETAIAARGEAIDLHGRAGNDDGDRERLALALSAQAMTLVRALRNAEADAFSRRAIALAETLPAGRALARACATESYLRMLDRDHGEAIG